MALERRGTLQELQQAQVGTGLARSATMQMAGNIQAQSDPLNPKVLVLSILFYGFMYWVLSKSTAEGHTPIDGVLEAKLAGTECAEEYACLRLICATGLAAVCGSILIACAAKAGDMMLVAALYMAELAIYGYLLYQVYTGFHVSHWLVSEDDAKMCALLHNTLWWYTTYAVIGQTHAICGICCAVCVTGAMLAGGGATQLAAAAQGQAQAREVDAVDEVSYAPLPAGETKAILVQP